MTNYDQQFEVESSMGHARTKTLTITSGKGGVGKTSIVCNLANQLSKQGKRVLILDGDLGMANVDVMFGKRVPHNILSVINGEMSLDEILFEVKENIYLVSGGSGIKDLQNLSEFQRRLLIDQVTQLPQRFDYLIIDTAPGIDDNVLYLNAAVHQTNIIITPDPASLTDSYALIKVLNKYYKQNRFSIISNFVKDEHEGLSIFKRISDVSAQFLNVSLDYVGFVPLDASLRKATKLQQLVTVAEPGSPSSLAISDLSKKLSGFNDIEEINGGLQFFWKHLFGVA